MRNYECPSCGAPIKFASAATVFAVCEHCRSMVVRSDVELKAIGTMAELIPDITPLQLGTTGRFNDQSFTLLGKLRLNWGDGAWTEWYAEFAGGIRGWIAETQGFYAVSFARDQEDFPRKLLNLNAGHTVAFSRRRWRIVDRKRVVVAGAEGELPFVAQPGAERYSIDLAGPNGEFGTLEESGGEVSFYEGAYAFAADLDFKNLRPVPGWNDPTYREPVRRATRTVRCPHCAAQVEVRLSGLTLAVVCGSCQSIIDPANTDVQVIQRASQVNRQLDPVLPLGIRGNFNGVTFEIVGYVLRGDEWADWSEYLLFNPWHGFIWLVTYNGHWSLIYRLLTPPYAASSSKILYQERKYALFASGKSKVKAVLGEFYWRVQRGEETFVSDYISPPHIISSETYTGYDEVTWSAGEYRKPQEIAAAFQLENPLPSPRGIYLNQPNPYARKWPVVRAAGILLLIAVCFLQIYFLIALPKRKLLSANFSAPLPAGVEEVSTPVFTLDGVSQSVHATIAAPLHNSWIDSEIELVNADNGQTSTEQLEISYESGRDSDGPWTEGSPIGSVDFPAVSPGRYLLRISPATDAKFGPIPFSVTVETGGIFWTNFIVCLLPILAYPLYVFLRYIGFEHTRWSDSDFSSFASTAANDDD
ncbi:MAG TPA: DUF4178 domain-containing protein [Opitutaceae bacterium]|nr:DUF4178 domain-containing protein [Opitutaceae bacterium]